MLVAGVMVWASGAHAVSVRPVDGEPLAAQRAPRIAAPGQQASKAAKSQISEVPAALAIRNDSSPILGGAGNELTPTLALGAVPSVTYALNVATPVVAVDAKSPMGQNNISQRFQHTLPAEQPHVLQIADNSGGVDVVSAKVSAVPLPGAIWMFGTALLGFIGFSSRRHV